MTWGNVQGGVAPEGVGLERGGLLQFPIDRLFTCSSDAIRATTPLRRRLLCSRTVRAVLAVLRRSTQRMSPVRRAKFLEAALQPALKATKRVAAEAAAAAGATGNAPADPRQRRESSGGSDDEGHDDGAAHGGGHGTRASPPPSPPLPAEHAMPSRAAFEAAASAAETATDFAGPLIEQACAERAALLRFGPGGGAAANSGRVEGRSLAAGNSANVGDTSGSPARPEEAASASDLSLAAYVGFALSALELAAETSTCTAGAAGDGGAATASAAAPSAASRPVAAAPGAPPAPPDLEDDRAAAARAALARAEERLVGLVVGGSAAPFLDLRFLLLHGCRLSHADRAERRRRRRSKSGKKNDGQGIGRGWGAGFPPGGSGGPVGLGEAAVGGALPWTLAGVSSLAYLVSKGWIQGQGRTVVASAFCGWCGTRVLAGQCVVLCDASSLGFCGEKTGRTPESVANLLVKDRTVRWQGAFSSGRCLPITPLPRPPRQFLPKTRVKGM